MLLLELLRRYWRELTIIGLLTALAWPTKPPAPLETTTDRIVYKDRIVTRDVVKWRDRTKTVVKPDGTKIITETKSGEQTESHTAEKQIAEEHQQTKPAVYDIHRYSLGFKLKSLDPQAVIIEGGVRLGNWPLSLEAEYDWQAREPALGLRYDF